MDQGQDETCIAVGLQRYLVHRSRALIHLDFESGLTRSGGSGTEITGGSNLSQVRRGSGMGGLSGSLRSFGHVEVFINGIRLK